MIGIFDSGDGGLPTLKAVRELLPQYSYIYIGDHARAPYGDRSQKEIFEFTWQGMEFLFKQGCLLVILACNTASVNALRHIQQEILPSTYPDRRVLGILVPTVEQIADTVSNNTVLVLGTMSTINSHAYVTEVQKRNPNRHVIQQACPELVSLIETRASHTRIGEALDVYLQPYRKTLVAGDVVVLGCTHYELIKDLIAEHLPDGVILYGQSEILAQSLKSYLERHPDMETRLKRDGSVQYLTSGESSRVSARAPFVHVDLLASH
ncbi:MAG: glutamate racemase [Patescibacteria group bacterium]